MALCSRWMPNYQGVICPTLGVIRPQLPSRIHCRSWSRFRNHQSMPVPSGKMGNGRTPCFVRNKYALSVVGRNHQLPSIDDDFDQEPFWSNVLKKSFWALKSLSRFLVEQPSQLKYIEWPSFQSTSYNPQKLRYLGSDEVLTSNERAILLFKRWLLHFFKYNSEMIR
ncbi:uncharacterized protein [Coffea arabica]|uniref:Uncharacterized protein isoform X2 n=1 Tax=Coffea arabica TaxID=13443 RepID=A0ABM4VNQ1_COFAR